MSITELEELLRLKKWTKRQLAAELSMSENAIYRWFIDRQPSSAASVLMRTWLEEARSLAGKLSKRDLRRIAEARELIARLEGQVS